MFFDNRYVVLCFGYLCYEMVVFNFVCVGSKICEKMVFCVLVLM